MKNVSVRLDSSNPGPAFPRIHEGRYEVDPEKTQIVPPSPLLVQSVKKAGIRLMRVGVGVWLPSQEPNSKELKEREWFKGSTLADALDDSLYEWTHLDRVIDTCVALGCEVLLSVDYMPGSLAIKRDWELPEFIRQFVPPGYTFPDGVRNNAPADPEVFAKATLKLLKRVEERGAHIRYVELWNEPDIPIWWAGTFDEFWYLYVAFARVVSEAGYRVGGPSWAGLEEDKWFHSFIDRAAKEQVPLDFYSWHFYPSSFDATVDKARSVRERLDSAGLSATESITDEWGWDLKDPFWWGTAKNAAYTAACFIAFAANGVSAQTQSLLVDPTVASFGRTLGLTRREGEPNPVWFAVEAFERFQSTPNVISSAGKPVALAGLSEDGTRLQAIFANPYEEQMRFELAVEGSVPGNLSIFDQESFDSEDGWRKGEEFELKAGAEVVLEPWTLGFFEGLVGG
ncbi:MAG TPA: hypothetical protein VND22_02160 [Actinomycetota bacterium]|nr:hypothetical protein [Actinomycetota bacterium]